MSENYTNFLDYDPWSIILEFEKTVAAHCGSPLAIAFDTGTIALELAFRWCYKKHGKLTVTLPNETFYSVPQAVVHAGHSIAWDDKAWTGQYQCEPTNIIDSACRFNADMYIPGTMMMVSFDIRKHLKIGRGGMLLLDNSAAFEWLKKAQNNGRQPGTPGAMPEFPGWNCKIDPDRATRGMMLMRDMPKTQDDLPLTYPDISECSYV